MSEQHPDWVDSIEILGHWGEAATITAEAMVAWAEFMEAL